MKRKATDGQDKAPAKQGAGSLPAVAKAYVALVAAVAVAVSLPVLSQLQVEPSDLLVFALLCLGAAFGSLLIVSTERNHGFNTALVFIAAAVVLLPPALVALMGLAQYWPELVRRRYPWYTQVFNLANYTLNALAAWGAWQLVVQSVPGQEQVAHALGAAAACLVLVGSNHLLLACALHLGRARSFRETGLFSWKSLSTDLMLASLGVTVAGFWEWNPYLVPLTIAPFVLISRSFSLLELLHRSERRFRAIYESAAVGIGLTDTAGRLVDHNRAFGEMLGVPGEELVGKELSELTAADESSVADGLFDELVQGQRESYALEQRYRRADGEVVWGHLTASVVRDSDGNPEFAVGMVHDVSDRKQLEERLNQAQKLDAVGRLAGGVAHDFNNLLTVITVHSGFLLGSLDPRDTGQRADVEAIDQAAQRAASLTQQLLAFGRKQVLQPRIVDLNSIVIDTNKMLHRLIGERFEVVTALGSDLWDVQADPGQIEQVLVNLALNARDAMADGGTLTIRTANVDAGAGADRRGRGAVRGPLRLRLRLRHGRRDAGADLRAVLHDEAERRNRARARERLRDRCAERRLHRRLERRRTRARRWLSTCRASLHEHADLDRPGGAAGPRDGRRDHPARRGRGRCSCRGAADPRGAGIHRARGIRRRRGARARSGPHRHDRPAADGRRDAAEDRARGRGRAAGAAARAEGALRLRARRREDPAARAGRAGHGLRPEAVHARWPGGRCA